MSAGAVLLINGPARASPGNVHAYLGAIRRSWLQIMARGGEDTGRKVKTRSFAVTRVAGESPVPFQSVRGFTI